MDYGYLAAAALAAAFAVFVVRSYLRRSKTQQLRRRLELGVSPPGLSPRKAS